MKPQMTATELYRRISVLGLCGAVQYRYVRDVFKIRIQLNSNLASFLRLWDLIGVF
jgi:hypothetical protein